MKEVKYYICEICGTEYKEKQKAQECEEGHKKPVEIKEAIYISIDNDLTGYPTRIRVKMSDGSERIYKRG